jgi:PhnB protein
MSVKTTAHINFNGEARTALEFYQSVFGGETAIATYADIHAAENEFHATRSLLGV